MVKNNILDRRAPIVVEDCYIGRRMEIKMAEVVTKIENIEKDQETQKEERKEMQKGIQSILDRFDNLDNKYASKDEINLVNKFSMGVNKKVNWVITGSISVMFTIIMFLIQIVINYSK